MPCCPPINGAPPSLPTAAESYPRGAALATLTQKMQNARLVTESGQVLNSADLLDCICDSTKGILDELRNIWRGGQTLTESATLTVPTDAAEAVGQNRTGGIVFVSHGGPQFEVADRATFSTRASLSSVSVTIPETFSETSDNPGVVINYFG